MDNHIFNAFPKPIQDFTMEAKTGLNFPVEYVLNSVLYAASVAIGNTYQVRVKNGWYEGANLFMAIIGETGVAKSHAISIAIKPLLDKNQEFFKHYKEQLKEYQQFNKNKSNSEFISEPHLEQVLADDATLEAMYRIHHHNPRGIGVYFDELRGWFNNMGKYNKGSDQEVWLKIWSRKPIIVNRVSSSPISLMSPHISVIGGIQTELVSSLFKDDRDKNGFVERILFVTTSKTQKDNFSEADMPRSVLSNYSSLMNKLIQLQYRKDEEGKALPHLLELSKAASERYREYFNFNAAKVKNPDTSRKIKGFYAKFDTYTIRFALILQLLYWCCEEDEKDEISLRAMDGAINLSEYFLQNVEDVINSVQQPIKLTNDHKRLFAIELVNRDTMSLREIAGIIGVSHETIRKWTSKVDN